MFILNTYVSSKYIHTYILTLIQTDGFERAISRSSPGVLSGHGFLQIRCIRLQGLRFLLHSRLSTPYPEFSRDINTFLVLLASLSLILPEPRVGDQQYDDALSTYFTYTRDSEVHPGNWIDDLSGHRITTPRKDLLPPADSSLRHP